MDDCHYSGVNSEGGMMLLGSCSYSKNLFIFTIEEDMSLMQMYLQLGKKCDQINPSSTFLQYLAPHRKLYVTLNEDPDVSNMIRLFVYMKVNIIDMIAIRKEEIISSDKNILRNEFDADNGSSSASQYEMVLQSNSIDAWSHLIRGEGQNFKNADEFRKVLKNYAIATMRSFVYKKNDQQKVFVVCNVSGCSWKIYASKYKADGTFGIRKCCLQHVCEEANLRSRGHPKADSAWVANIIKDKLRGEPSYRPSAIVRDIHREYGVELKYHTAWMGKEIAMHQLYGTEKGCFDKLRWYCDALKQTNPGSWADCEVDEMNKFRRLFISLHACIVGFVKGCRPLIFLDGTHIKNKFKGCILSAVTKDANDDLFTLAFAVVEAENDANWEWFCLKLRGVLAMQNCIVFSQFTFFSDRHSGLVKILKKYPLHNKKYWESIFHKAAYAATESEFIVHIISIIQSMPLAEEFIKNSEPENWANCLFSGKRWGIINNNQAECWNSWVKPARYLPIVSMIDTIRLQIMSMMNKRRESSLLMVGILSPKPESSLLQNYTKSRNLKVDRSSSLLFEVLDGDKSCAVDLGNWSCSCRIWKINGILCNHACAAIESKGLSIYDFCDSCYKVENYRRAYAAVVNPIPTFDFNADLPHSNGDIIRPPDVRSQPGRRRTQRFPSQVKKRVTKCARCHKPGHNRRKCKEAI
ncbi:uncharacterized protein [Henckelia pumila]|uniref:uncharacterized protein n=1 Tax=Henckelia pumila TaxID=405737 RepID=UPI003C6E3E11